MNSTPHPLSEEAAAYVFGTMTAEQQLPFLQQMERDPDLQALVAEWQETAAMLTLDAPQLAAPAELRSSVLASIAQQPQERHTVQTAPQVLLANKPRTTGQNRSWLGWAAAACLAALCTAQWLMHEKASTELQATLTQTKQRLSAAETAREQLQRDLQHSAAELAQREQTAIQLKQELARLSQSNDSAKTQIAMLQATLADYKQGVAVVVWNNSTQEGILKLEKMPPAEPGKDYQLWVVDPSKKTPVNAGVITLDQTGFAKVDFKPNFEVQKAEKFAISIEEKGGSPENKGPIILLSE
jgi:anti-sigma-K factor RskA